MLILCVEAGSLAGLVFGKREALLHHYVPDFLPHRWEELERLKRWFKPISQKSEYEDSCLWSYGYWEDRSMQQA